MWMDEVLTSDLTSYESQKQTSYYKFSRDPSWADRNSTETTPWIGTPQ